MNDGVILESNVCQGWQVIVAGVTQRVRHGMRVRARISEDHVMFKSPYIFRYVAWTHALCHTITASAASLLHFRNHDLNQSLSCARNHARHFDSYKCNRIWERLLDATFTFFGCVRLCLFEKAPTSKQGVAKALAQLHRNHE